MKKGLKFLVIVLTSVVFLRCKQDPKEVALLQATADSLKIEIVSNQKASETLQQIGSLIDSIDASRYALRISLEAGTSYDNYVSRMQSVSDYLKSAKLRISKLESQLKTAPTKHLPSSYTSAVKKLKHDLDMRNADLAELSRMAEQYTIQNKTLKMRINVQQTQLNEKIALIEKKKKQFIELQKNQKQLAVQARRFEAESLFIRAQAVEEAANRTRFAPKKKKQTRMYALELYRQSYQHGKEEARVKVKELEKKI